MCKFGWVVSVGSVFGMVQSILWMVFGFIGVLTYLCAIPVPPYETENDFFRVTLVKLYFEGPRCQPDGGYMGEFKKYYRDVTKVYTPDIMFGVMMIYAILDVVYFFLSVMLYKNRRRADNWVVAALWAATTLVFCILDFFSVLAFVVDVLTFPGVIPNGPLDVKNIEMIPSISVLLALISSRVGILWLWNFIIGGILLMDALCCRNIIKKPRKPKKQAEKPKEVEEAPKRPEEAPQPPVSIMNGNFRTYFDVLSHPDYLDYKKSMEAVTRFNTAEKPPSVKDSPHRTWTYAPTEASWHPKSHSSREWEFVNEGYVGEEPEKNVDFDHNLKNFESGQQKIKIVRPPLGKPVSIPVPPPLPPNDSYNC